MPKPHSTDQNISAASQSVLSSPASIMALSPSITTVSNSPLRIDNQEFALADSFQVNSPQLSIEISPSTSSNASQQACNDSDNLFSLRVECSRNLLLGFLNINSLRNKTIDLRMIAEKCLPDILLIEETKLDSDFKADLFLINNYKSPIRLDMSEFGGGLMQYSRNGIICNRVTAFEVPSLELMCSEITITKKKWII